MTVIKITKVLRLNITTTTKICHPNFTNNNSRSLAVAHRQLKIVYKYQVELV